MIYIEYCQWCNSRITDDKLTNCSQCGAPIGDREVEIIKVYKPVTEIVRTDGFNGIRYYIKYKDGTMRSREFTTMELYEKTRELGYIGIEDYISETLIKEFDIDYWDVPKVWRDNSLLKC